MTSTPKRQTMEPWAGAKPHFRKHLCSTFSDNFTDERKRLIVTEGAIALETLLTAIVDEDSRADLGWELMESLPIEKAAYFAYTARAHRNSIDQKAANEAHKAEFERQKAEREAAAAAKTAKAEAAKAKREAKKAAKIDQTKH